MNTHHSAFDFIARDDDAPVIAARKALALASKRVEDRFGAFLARVSGADTTARFELIREDFDAVVAAACEEVGHEDVGGLTRLLWNDRISRVSGDNPFAKKDSDDDDDKKCDCKGDEECAKCKKDDDDDKKGNPFAKKDSSRTASTHEARKPKLCPYHNEVMGISLAQGEPAAGYNAMASHAWTGKHCQGDEYEGNRCNFKPEMTTQSYWDAKAEKSEERKRERAEQTQQTTDFTEPVENGFEPEQTTEPVADVEPMTEDGEVEVDAGLPEQELMAVAASTKRFIPKVADLAPMTQKGIAAELQSMVTQGMSEEKALQMLAERHGLTEEQIHELAQNPEKEWDNVGGTRDGVSMRPWTGSNRVAEALEHQDLEKNTFPKMDRSNERPKSPPDTEMDGTPHPTEQVDIQPDIDDPDRAKRPENKDPKDIGENTTEHQDVTQGSEFSNKYPNRWASADAAIATFNQ